MEIIADTGREIGKTTALIKLAAESGGVIIINNITLVGYVYRLAEHLGLKLKSHQVASYKQVLNGYLRGRAVSKILYFDDWDYKTVTINQLTHECFCFQVGGVVTAQTRAEIELCLHNT